MTSSSHEKMERKSSSNGCSSSARQRYLTAETALLLLAVVSLWCMLLGVRTPRLPSPLPQITGALLMLIGGFFFVSAPQAIGNTLFLFPVLPTGRLVTSGVFTLCRHPQYAGILALSLGVTIMTCSPHRLVWTLFLMLALDKKADLEEEALSKKHPEYAQYVLEIPKFLPHSMRNLRAIMPGPIRQVQPLRRL